MLLVIRHKLYHEIQLAAHLHRHEYPGFKSNLGIDHIQDMKSVFAMRNLITYPLLYIISTISRFVFVRAKAGLSESSTSSLSFQEQLSSFSI